MAKTKLKKKSSTTAKIKELTGVKPEKVTDEQLNRVQEAVNNINRAQLEIGSMEVQKHELMHRVSSLRESLGVLQQEFEKEYGTYDVNIQDGTINYPKENGEADKKD